MKLALVYHVWDDYELLQRSVELLGPLADQTIIVYSQYSNYGEYSAAPEWVKKIGIPFEPDQRLPAQKNERAKRNFGLNLARSAGATHFLNLDADEFYEPSEFLKEKERILKHDIAGAVCRTKVYFKRPDLTIGYDTTLVPFIHKISPSLCFTWNPRYPYAFEGVKREIRIDPTRQMNPTFGIEWSEITMHHMSQVRPDIEKKIRNSTARFNIEGSSLVTDFELAKPGYFCEFYGRHLEPCSDLFGLCSLEFIKAQRQKT